MSLYAHYYREAMRHGFDDEQAHELALLLTGRSL